MSYPKIFLKKNEDRRIRSGHLWIFSNEIEKTDGNPESGDIVSVYDHRDEIVAQGFYNKNSLISVRILSRNIIDDLQKLFADRLANAYKLRKSFYPSRDSFRLVFSESDYLPGLIIDKYNKTFVLQVYSAGMEKNIQLIIRILKDEYSAENIFAMNEEHFRVMEGLSTDNTIYYGKIDNEIIEDGSIKYKVDFASGHKTGFYFDQSDNRFFIEKICKEKSVLDAFCNSGGFGLHSLKSGADRVTFVDSSAAAIELVKVNLELNMFTDKYDLVTSDVFDYLSDCINGNKNFDVVMIDPPAFAKNKKNINQAKKGYEKLNRLALTLINNYGFLVTSSCSYHLPESEFISIINSAAVKTGREIQLIHFNRASFDHPALPAMHETSYLKFAIFMVR
ncbi:MAG: class I SAM-dependent rRNA methyltransferase [Ignavibacteriales bacterium]|nr:MAG: class I SAM-dependent rRNA methyltransferase [Ignavibacteriales bacterium]